MILYLSSLACFAETAKLNGVDSEAWLRDVLTRVAGGHPINRIVELMSWAWSR
jgi:transposase